jgi:hypothetical protein
MTDDEPYPELRAMQDRLCRLMGWERGTTAHKFDIVRQTCSGRAVALSIDCDYELQGIGQEFTEGMAQQQETHD